MTEVVAPAAGATCDHAHHSCDHAHHAAPSRASPPAQATPAPTSGSDSEGSLFPDEIRNVYLHPGIMDEFMEFAKVLLAPSPLFIAWFVCLV